MTTPVPVMDGINCRDFPACAVPALVTNPPNIVMAAPAGAISLTLGAVTIPSVESDAIEGCAGGIPFIQHQMKNAGVPSGVVHYTNAAGTVVAAPAGWTPGPCATATTPQTINTGTFHSSATFTQVNLPGIAGGGTLQSLTLLNVGTTDATVTTTDGHTETLSASGQMNWEVDSSADTLAGFSCNATGTTVVAVYTYR